MSARVLVTGGAGFIGSHLCKRLVEQGCEVLCVDNYFTGSKSNVIGLQDFSNFELMRHDVTLVASLILQFERSSQHLTK